MISGGVVEAFGSGHPKVTMTGSAAITAGQLVAMTGNRTVGPAGAASTACVGVAMQSYDNTAGTGSKLAVATGGVWFLTASGSIAAGDTVVCAANGAVATAGAAPDARTVVGRALEAITGGATGRVLLKI